MTSAARSNLRITAVARRWAALTGAALALASGAGSVQADVTISAMKLGLPNTILLRINGPFTGNEVLRVKSAIAALPPTTRVIAALSSPGGRLSQGTDLGTFFYESKIPTMVLAGDSCASACSFAFYGGRDPTTGKPQRIMVDGARLGFHNFSSSGLPDQDYTAKDMRAMSRDSQQTTYQMLQYFQSVEAPIEALLLLANSATANDMLWLDSGRALSFGISVLNREINAIVMPNNLDLRTGRP